MGTQLVDSGNSTPMPTDSSGGVAVFRDLFLGFGWWLTKLLVYATRFSAGAKLTGIRRRGHATRRPAMPPRQAGVGLSPPISQGKTQHQESKRVTFCGGGVARRFLAEAGTNPPVRARS